MGNRGADLSYEINLPLDEDGRDILYRGVISSDQCPIIVKRLRAPHSSQRDLERFRNESAMTQRVLSPYVNRVIALVESPMEPALLLEDFGGIPLKRVLGKPLDPGTFLPFAIQIAHGLADIHQQEIIHRDIKPKNLFVNVTTGELKIGGFGYATLAQGEFPAANPPRGIDGTFAYMSPEQTGRMNRMLDSRSDLYSLGVTYYEMLTGELPFHAADALGWVHGHIARSPVSPKEMVPSIPEPLSDIVMKLMAKLAEERYQSAQGVAHDLARCLAQWDENKSITPFPLAHRDFSGRFQIPQRIYGRKPQVAQLLAAFDRIAGGRRGELLLVSGHSGIGKTALICELQQPVARSRGYFLSGKSDEFQRNIPYFTIAQAFQGLLREILMEDDARLRDWRQRLQSALGTNGKLIVDMLPLLERIINNQPPVPELPLSEAQNRFRMVWRQFVGVFCRPEHPIALFLDDLQWADPATLDLLSHMLVEPETRFLLVIGAYRTNEVGHSHPLREALDGMRKSGAELSELSLAPLSLAELGELVSDTLRDTREEAEPVARLLLERTEGNPFFAIQLLMELNQEHAFAFDFNAVTWRWNLEYIRAKGYTGNVAELMKSRLKRLSEPALDILKFAACMGNRFDIGMLAQLLQKPQADVIGELEGALREGLLLHSGDLYRFPHDRIHEAAFALVSPGIQPGIHLDIGRGLLTHLPGDELARELFVVVNHLNLGAALMRDPVEKRNAADLNLTAGRKAKGSAAYASAAKYLSAGLAMLPDDAWHSDYPLTFAIEIERARCELLGGDFAASAKLIAELLEHARGTTDRTAVYQAKIELETIGGSFANAGATILEACSTLFGIQLTLHPTRDQLQAEIEGIRVQLAGRPISSLLELPPMQDPEAKAALAMFAVSLPPAYFNDSLLHDILACHMARVSLSSGNTEASAMAYALLGDIMGIRSGNWKEARDFANLAIDLMQRQGFVASKGKIWFVVTVFVQIWIVPLHEAIAGYRQSFHFAVQAGDLIFACYAGAWGAHLRLLSGASLPETAAEIEAGLEFCRRAKYQPMADVLGAINQMILCLRGKTNHLSTYDGPGFDQRAYEVALEANPFFVHALFYYLYKMLARFLSGDYEEALTALGKAKSLIHLARGQLLEVEFVFYASLVTASLHDTTSPGGLRDFRIVLIEYQEKLRGWAELMPANHQNRYALVSAELARIDGRTLDAERFYDEAIRSARENGFVQNEAIAYELASRFYQQRGLDTLAVTFLREARARFESWGATAKVAQIDRRFPEAAPQTPVAASQSEAEMAAGQLDLLAVVKASQVISSEILLPELQKTLMRILVEQSGAQRGCLIAPQTDGSFQVEAAASVGASGILEELPPVSTDLPDPVIQFVIRSRETLLLDDAQESPFAREAYVVRTGARSIMCMPIQRKSGSSAVIYLENKLITGAFASAKLDVVKLLATQASISFESAELYARLLASENRYRTIVETAHEGIWSIDAKSMTTFVNPKMAEMLGYTVVEMQGKPLDAFMDEEGKKIAAENLKRREVGIAEQHDFKFLRKDGSALWALLEASPLYDQNNVYTGALAMVADITERKRMETEKQRVLDSLAESDRLKSQFIRMTAHELKTPVTIVKAYAQVMQIGSEQLTPSLRNKLEAIERGANRIAHIVNDMLDVAQLQLGKIKLAPKQFDLRALVQETASNLALIDKGNHRIHLHDATQVLVWGDERRVEQVLSNLIGNALKYSPMGGDVELGISTREKDAVVSVKDHGIGIPRDKQDRVFELFFQAHSETASDLGGMGAGLFISRELIKAQGGAIWFESEEGVGSTFSFSIPLPAVHA